MSDKTLFTTIDMRNAKYQGAVKQNTPQGLGFLFNLDHQLVLTHWNREDIQGPTLLIYPNRNYLYGHIRNKRLDGIVTYHKANGQTYHFNFINGITEKIAHDESNGVVTELTISEDKMLAGESEKIKNNNKWQIISRILGTDVQIKFKGVKNFIRECYEKEQHDLFECCEGSGLTFLGFKNTASLGVKFDRNQQVSQVGTFQAFPQNIEFGRKYTSNPSKAVKIQEGRFSQPQKVFTYERTRPTQAIKFTEQYFKCGTTFKNIFFKAPIIKDIEAYIQTVQKQISKLYMLQYGQRILQRDKKQQTEDYENKSYHIDEVKRDILAKLDRRQHGGRRSDRTFGDSREELEHRLTPSRNYKDLYRDIGSEPRDLSSSKRINKLYVYTEVAKDQPGPTLSPSPHKYQRIDQPLRQPQQFTLYQPSPQKNKAYYPYQPRRQDLYLDLRQNYRNNVLEEAFTFKNRRGETFFDRSPLRTSPNKARIIHQPTGQHFVNEPKSKYAYVSDSSKSKRQKIGEPFTFNSAQNNQQDVSNYENYLKYKNRNNTPIKNELSSVRLPKRYDIHQGEQGRENDPQRQQQTAMTRGVLAPARYKKYFKYL